MSVEAISWALNDAPGVPAPLVVVLIGLANHAGPDGRGAYPSQATLARYARKDPRTVRRDLARLEALGLIRRGDQRLVEHLPADRRPVVWDLAVECREATGDDSTKTRNDHDGGTSTSARTCATGRTSMSKRPDAHVRTGRTPTSAKPSYEPSRTVSQSARAKQAQRWLIHRYRLTDVETDAVIAEVQRRAGATIGNLVAYMNGMAEGDLADIVAAVMDAAQHPEPTEPADRRPPWCGQCDSENTRFVELDDGRVAKCPNCHPLREEVS